MKKENIEIRFFFDKKSAKNAIKLWKKEKRRFKPNSFADFYFLKSENIAKIRKWRSQHKPKIELIKVKRTNSLKKESSKPIKNIFSLVLEIKKLMKSGYKKSAVIKKEKGWLVKKDGKLTYAIENIKGLGWSGEIEVPEKEKRLIPKYTSYLRKLGARDFSKKSMLDLYIKWKK